MALTTRAAVKAQAGILPADTSKDAQIDAFIAGITGLIRRKLNRNLELTTYTEYYSGDNSPVLQLRQFPVQSITSIITDPYGYFGQGPNGFNENTATTLVDGVDYALMAGQNGIGSNGRVRRINAVWWGRESRQLGYLSHQPPLPNGNIQVIYAAGYSPGQLPEIQMAINEAVVKKVQFAKFGGGVASAGYEDASVSFMSPKDMAAVFGAIESTFGSFKIVSI